MTSINQSNGDGAVQSNEVELEDLGDWGKHLVKEYKLSVEDAMSLELEAAELYAHGTRDGWCCACDVDIAFATKYIQEEPEFAALLNSEKAKMLERLKKQAIKVRTEKPGKPYMVGGRLTNIYHESIEAVPTSVIEQHLEELRRRK